MEAALSLPGPVALLLARLVSRQGPAWRVPDLSADGVDDVSTAVAGLCDVGLLLEEVDGEVQRRLATREVLAAACRRRGLPVGGTRAVLVERLAGVDGWDDATWVALSPVLLRVERMATLAVWPDRAAAVKQRMGVQRWASYALTDGALVPDRAAWDAWEAVVGGLEALTVEEGLAALDAAIWPPGGLDRRRDVVERVFAAAQEAERAGAWTDADAALMGLWRRGWGLDGEVAVRRARVLEKQGRVVEARAWLREAFLAATGTARLTVGRAARRLARGAGGVAPDPPMLSARERTLRLASAGQGIRPLWAAGTGTATVEQAVIVALAEAGRTAVVAEGPLWRTLVGLLLLPTYFLPVPGQLPVPFLPGPLDLGRPSFVAGRMEAVAEVRAAVRAGEGPARIAEACSAWAGTRLSWVRWEVASPEVLVAVAEGVGPHGLLAVLDALLDGGRGAAAGMPDLVVLPGAAAEIGGALPRRLGEGLVLVEVKGPGDALRDGQRVWIDRLVRAGVGVELWWVDPAAS